MQKDFDRKSYARFGKRGWGLVVLKVRWNKWEGEKRSHGYFGITGYF
jgi:hypothetical protein